MGKKLEQLLHLLHILSKYQHLCPSGGMSVNGLTALNSRRVWFSCRKKAETHQDLLSRTRRRKWGRMPLPPQKVVESETYSLPGRQEASSAKQVLRPLWTGRNHAWEEVNYWTCEHIANSSPKRSGTNQLINFSTSFTWLYTEMSRYDYHLHVLQVRETRSFTALFEEGLDLPLQENTRHDIC